MKRFNTTESGYRFDKLIFFPMILIVLGVVVFFWHQNGFDFKQHIYVKCSDFGNCSNPLMDTNVPEFQKYKANCLEEWCNQKTLLPGVYGKPPPSGFLYNSLGWLSWLFFAFCLVMNHFVHNRGKPIDFEIRVGKYLILNRKKVGELQHEESKGNSNN